MTDQPTSSQSPVLEKPSKSKETTIAPYVRTLLLPAIPIREGVLFPSTESVLTFGRPLSLATLNEITPTHNMVVLLTQKSSQVDNPQPEDLYPVGTLALVDKTLKTEENVNALVRGIGRVKVTRFVSLHPKIIVEVQELQDVIEVSDQTKALSTHLQKEFRRAIQMGKPVEFLNFMKLMGGVSDSELTDQIASTLNLDTPAKQKILQTLSVKDRMKFVSESLAHEIKVMEIEKDVVSKTQKQFDKAMRENVLRERMRTIQKELGDLDEEEETLDEYVQKLKKLQVSAEIKEKISKEIKRLRAMSPNNPESGYVRTWLDTVFELPWGKSTKSNIDLKTAGDVLSKNHYGLDKVKDRILEYIAVLEIKNQRRKPQEGQANLPTILCFIGPPGVGKTSIGKAIAQSMKRKFVKVSLGGIHDEAEIRGHRRTYVGAMPGRIIAAMKQAKSMNPIFMLDEVDKIGNDFRGDPSAALLEALDPEQNKSFEDHYLDMPFDLSGVLFITTANTLETIPPALKDRLEIIYYTGYTQEEKFEIAKRHLMDKVREANGLKASQVKTNDEAIKYVIERYTAEAGVRELERTLSTLMRKVARSLVEKKHKQAVLIDVKFVRKQLGPEKYDVDIKEKEDVVGQSTGLAWTSVGGSVLFIEVALTKGKGVAKLTGKLGDVMKESAQAALTYVKANAKTLGIDETRLQETDVHLHIPEGAIPKDGPSAGITMVTAIVSAFTGQAVRKDIAMTGEVTLRGRVLRIGGLKEKSIAAHKAGCTTVIIPKDNVRDLEEIPESVKKSIKFVPVTNVADVLKLALA